MEVFSSFHYLEVLETQKDFTPSGNLLLFNTNTSVRTDQSSCALCIKFHIMGTDDTLFTVHEVENLI